MGRSRATATIDPLESWHALQATIHTMTEDDLTQAIEKEIDGKARLNMVMRMYMKRSKLRRAREIKELTQRVMTAAKRR
jgi:hypothetical protein